MHIQRGKAWEIWPRAVISGRQRVDTWGLCPVMNSEAISCNVNLRAGGQSVHKTASIQALSPPFCILQAIKDWRWELPGNEATSE